MPPLSLSILGVEPMDEFIREVADFIYHMIGMLPRDTPGATVEVEAKIGILRDRLSGNRLNLPVLTETILSPNFGDFRFESNMTSKQHQHFNVLLNGLKTSPPSTVLTPLNYTHLYLVDSFYPSPDSSSGPDDKIRVTRDERTGEVKECVKKIRLGDLNIYCPKRVADWRISVNIEIPVPHPLGSATHTRRKDRMSYLHEEFNIDLTQVTSNQGTVRVTHELEVEVARPALLLATAANRGNPNVPEHERGAFDELIRAFVNNARTLIRNVSTD